VVDADVCDFVQKSKVGLVSWWCVFLWWMQMCVTSSKSWSWIQMCVTSFKNDDSGFGWLVVRVFPERTFSSGF
jgi:hypothetical protein